jgi:hypothetical protein
MDAGEWNYLVHACFDGLKRDASLATHPNVSSALLVNTASPFIYIPRELGITDGSSLCAIGCHLRKRTLWFITWRGITKTLSKVGTAHCLIEILVPFHRPLERVGLRIVSIALRIQ